MEYTMQVLFLISFSNTILTPKFQQISLSKLKKKAGWILKQNELKPFNALKLGQMIQKIE